MNNLKLFLQIDIDKKVPENKLKKIFFYNFNNLL